MRRPTRQCRKCLKKYPATTEHFVASKDCPGGITRTCKGCRTLYNRKWRARPEIAEARRFDSRARYEPVDMAAKRREYAQRAPYKARATVMRGGLPQQAKKGVPAALGRFTVAFIEAWLQRQPTCECCGVAFRVAVLVDGVKCDQSPSLDRFVPALGYVEGNVALLCWRCNNLKRDASAEELERVVRWMRTQEGNQLGLLPLAAE